jgi:hypothetical protein
MRYFAMAGTGPEDNSQQTPDAKPEILDSGRPRRAGPTIDLDASEVTSETRHAAADTAPEATPEPSVAPESTAAESAASGTIGPESSAQASPPESRPVSRPISPWVIAPVSGAVAAALVIGVGWMLGWPPVQPVGSVTPQVSAVTVDSLTERIGALESKVSKPAAPSADPASAAKIAALEKYQTSLRDELATLQAQSQKVAAEIGNVKVAPGDAAASMVDLSGITARLDAIESASRSQGAAIAQDNSKPIDDVPLRRVVVASLLELSVRVGDPFIATLAAAKSLAPDAAKLQPLEAFAATGVPTVQALSRELLTLVPKLSPPAAENDTTGAGIVDRLQAGAAKLVRIERTDAVGNDRGAIVARVTAAALRNDANEARRELNTLPAADRAAAQSWIEKADARDAALAVSRQFAADAMAALAKPAP